MMAFRKACEREALMSGEMIAVPAGGRRILLVEAGGALCAYENSCPHRGVPLSEGFLTGTTLTCAAHHWSFDVTTGRGINPDSVALASVPVQVVEGGIWIDDDTAGDDLTDAASPPDAAQGSVRSPAPQRAVPERAVTGSVGPVLIAGVVTDAVVEAIKEAHADARIVDQGAYLRVLVPERCIIRASAVRARLHAPFHIPSDLEPLMCSFKGILTASEDEAVFEAKRRRA